MSAAVECNERRPLLSGWWRRVGASLIDFLIVAVPIGLLALITHGYHTTHSAHTGRFVFARRTGFAVGSALIGIAYQLLTLCRPGRHNGQTAGDQLLGIVVARDTGERFGIATYVVRQLICQSLPGYLMPLLPGVGFALPLLIALDVLWPLWDPENRALHDIVARTHVLRVPGAA